MWLSSPVVICLRLQLGTSLLMYRHWIKSKTNFTHIPLVFQCCPVDKRILIGHSVVDEGQYFKPYLWSAWDLCSASPGSQS